MTPGPSGAPVVAYSPKTPRRRRQVRGTTSVWERVDTLRRVRRHRGTDHWDEGHPAPGPQSLAPGRLGAGVDRRRRPSSTPSACHRTDTTRGRPTTHTTSTTRKTVGTPRSSTTTTSGTCCTDGRRATSTRSKSRSPPALGGGPGGSQSGVPSTLRFRVPWGASSSSGGWSSGSRRRL